jgi:phosphatidylglycerophosphate synthase
VRIWIDATDHDERIEVFGMTLLERLLRSLLESQRQVLALKVLEKELKGLTEARTWIRSFVTRRLTPSEVRIELRAGAALPASIPRDLLASLPIVLSQGEATTRERLTEALRDAHGEPLVALSADTVVDVRVLEHLVWSNVPLAFFSGTGSERGAMLRLDGPLPPARGDETDDLTSIARVCLESGCVKEVGPDEFDGYVRKLRRNLPGWLFRVPDRTSAAKIERFLFWSNYKGATDFLTKYVYPPLVWRAVVPLAKRRVPPNAVTATGILCCFLAVPFFAAGWWLPGLFLAYAMTVLDSVDGKLARVTFSSSKQGDVLDHGTDVIHPPIWYWAWAWGLSGGDPFSGVFQASLWLTGLYIADRILESLFRSCTGGRSVQDFTPLDARLRTFVSRRNVNLALFTLGLALGLGVETFYAVVALQLATVLYHFVRVVQYWDGDEDSRVSSTAPRQQALPVALAPGGSLEA